MKPVVASVVGGAAPDQMKAATIVDVPMSGLNPLIALGSFRVEQQTEMLEAALNAISIGYEGANKYKVKAPDGRDMYFVAEESGCCMRQCCNPNHSMKLHVTDMNGVKVMTMDRPWNFNCCCCEWGNLCGKSYLDVYLGDEHTGDNIGSVRMPCGGGGFTPVLNVHGRDGAVTASVKGPCCFISDLCGAAFDVRDAAGNDVGKVSKLGVKSASGVGKELLTDADNYTISFPPTLGVESKAALIGALLLLDYTFFEDEGAFSVDPFSGECHAVWIPKLQPDCSNARVLSRTVWTRLFGGPYFENSTRAVDSPKNEPNRLRFDRAS